MARKNRFSVGDLVKLKSGGPIMTVDGYATFDPDQVICKWFSSKKLNSGHFSEDSLEKAETVEVDDK